MFFIFRPYPHPFSPTFFFGFSLLGVVYFSRLQVKLEFDENTEAFFGPNGILGAGGGGVIRSVPSRQKPELGVESLKSLVARLKGVIQGFKAAAEW